MNELKFGNKVIFLNGYAVSLPVAATDPSPAVNGDMYYSSATDRVKVYQAGSWVDLATGSGGVGAGIAGRLALYPSTSSVVDDEYVQNTYKIDVAITAQASRSTDLVYLIPNPGDAINTATFILTEGAASNAAVIGKVITGFASGMGTVAATDTLLEAINKLDGNAVAALSTANAALPSASFTASAVTSKVLTGYQSAAGLVADTDTILQAFNKLNGNVVNVTSTANAALPSASFTDAAVTSKLITGYVSGAGLVAATDTILQAINKLNGNSDAIKGTADAALASASFTDAAVTSKLLTGYVMGAGTVAATDTILQGFNKVAGNADAALSTANAALPSASFTDATVTSKLLTGYSSGAGTVAATDTILQAINKLNGNSVDIKATADGALQKSGGTMTGDIAMGLNNISSSHTASLGTDLVNKDYVDSLISGLTWKVAVEVFDLRGNLTIAGINGLSPVAGESWVATDAGTPTAGTSDALVAGDITEFDGTSWKKLVSGVGGFVLTGTRAILGGSGGTIASPYTEGTDNLKIVSFSGASNTGTDTGDSILGSAVFIQDLFNVSYYDNTGFVFNNILGDPVANGQWVMFTGAGQLNAGVGLLIQGNTLSIKLGAGITELPTGEVGIDVYSTNSGLILTVDGTTPSTVSGAKLRAYDIADANIAAAAAIAESKLALSYSTSSLNTAIGGKANQALDNLASVAINTTLVSDTNNTDDLGTDSIEWKDLWVHNIKHDSAGAPNLSILTTGNNGSIILGANGSGNLDIKATMVRRSESGASANFMEDQYLDALTLTANISTPTEISSSLSFAVASFDGAVINYRIKEATSNKVRIGQFIVSADGTIASSSDQFSETAALGSALGLILTADINAGNVRILYHNTHASYAATMRCQIRRFRA